MASIVKQSSIGLISNYFGIVLGFINVMLIMPAILSAEQIGLINLILSVVLLVYPILDFSAIQILKRYFTHVKDKQEIFNYSLLISSCGAILFFFVFLWGKPLFVKYYAVKSPEILSYYWWIYFVSIIMSWSGLAEGLGVIYGKYHITSFVKEIIFRLGIFLILGILFIHLISFKEFVYCNFIMYGVTGLLILAYLYQEGKFKFRFQLPHFSQTLRSNIFKFGSFSIFTGLASIIAIRIDMIMLGSMSGLKEVGIYTIAMYMATAIDVPRKTVLQSAAPIIRIAIRSHDIDKATQIHYKTIVNLILIAGFMLTLLMVNLHTIYNIIPNGEVYRKGFWVVLLIGLAKLAEMMNGGINEIITSSRYYMVNIIFIILLAILSVGLNFLLIPIYGIVGAAGSAFVATSIITLCKSVTFKWLFSKKVYDFKILSIILFYISLGTVLYYIPTFPWMILSIGQKVILASIALYFFMKFTQVSPDLNQLLNQFLSTLRLSKWIKL